MRQRVVRKYQTGAKCNLRQENGVDYPIWRIYALFFLVSSLAFIIMLRLYSLQVLSYESFQEISDNQHSLFRKLVPERGEIYLEDKNGVYPVAVNRGSKMAYAVPKEIEDFNGAVNFCKNELGLGEGELKEKFSKKEDLYEVLKHKISDEEIQRIREANIKGIKLADEDYRYYPAGELASHVLGFLGWKDSSFGGRYGTEAYFDEKLRGQEGNIFQNKDATGRWIAIGKKEIQEAKNGDSLVLTIDHIVQFETEKILKAAMKKFEADSGAIIVMEPQTGKILSMASFPNFNPNEYSKVEDMSAFRNLAVSDAYEPGSIFKTFTLAAGVDSGKISPDTTYVDTGSVNEAGYTIKNSDGKAYGQQTMTNVLEKSLNTGVIFAEKLIGNKNFADYMERFGFGSSTGTDIFSESGGNISNLKNLRSNIQFFTASFGQGITTTPLQLIAAYSSIANDGVLMKPQIVDKIIKSDGQEELIEPQEVGRVISVQSARDMAKMLESVVENGHGKRAGVPGYFIGGKTGTAQVAKNDAKGYQEGISIGSFAGFAPVDNPKFSIIIRMDNPKAVEWAESSAAPTFGELMKFLLEYYGVEPTREYTQKDIDTFNATHNLSQYFSDKEMLPEPEAIPPASNSIEVKKENPKKSKK